MVTIPMSSSHGDGNRAAASPDKISSARDLGNKLSCCMLEQSRGMESADGDPLDQFEQKDCDTGFGGESRSIVLSILKQLAHGSDLHRVTLPTFILEPRSLLERITDFMTHPHGVLHAHRCLDKEQRFLLVLEYYMSGWHVRPSGVKKPYNPVLGEFFRCSWKHSPLKKSDLESLPSHWQEPVSRCEHCSSSDHSHTAAYFFAEQVSHHPPVSAYFFSSPDHGLCVTGSFRPRSKFLGNSAVSLMGGSSRLTLTLDSLEKEDYLLTYPNIYVRGILIGTLLTELGDSVTIKCPSSDLVAEVDFKVKGFFWGSYNTVEGKVRRASTGQVLYKISGDWTSRVKITPLGRPNGSLSVLNISQLPKMAPTFPKMALQDGMESQR